MDSDVFFKHYSFMYKEKGITKNVTQISLKAHK